MKKPRYVFFNNAVNLPGSSLTGSMSIQPDKSPRMKMEIGPEGLYVEEVTKDGQTTVSGFIPLNNINLIVFEKEQVKKS